MSPPPAAALSLRCDAVSLVRNDATHGERTLLDAVTAAFYGGQVTLLTGPTGAGKSSLIHLLGGLLRPTSGTVYAGQTSVSRWVAGHRDRWRRTMGIALQAPNLLTDLTVLENVMLPLVPRFTRLDKARHRARLALEEAGASQLAGAAVATLSGGQRQRVALARAVVGRPDYLLVDEPTAHQDNAGTARVIDVLRKARDRGAVVVVTAHDPRLIDADLADQRLRLVEGRLLPDAALASAEGATS